MYGGVEEVAVAQPDARADGLWAVVDSVFHKKMGRLPQANDPLLKGQLHDFLYDSKNYPIADQEVIGHMAGVYITLMKELSSRDLPLVAGKKNNGFESPDPIYTGVQRAADAYSACVVDVKIWGQDGGFSDEEIDSAISHAITTISAVNIPDYLSVFLIKNAKEQLQMS
jgi:hypothetical protein